MAAPSLTKCIYIRRCRNFTIILISPRTHSTVIIFSSPKILVNFKNSNSLKCLELLSARLTRSSNGIIESAKQLKRKSFKYLSALSTELITSTSFLESQSSPESEYEINKKNCQLDYLSIDFLFTRRSEI